MNCDVEKRLRRYDNDIGQLQAAGEANELKFNAKLEALEEELEEMLERIARERKKVGDWNKERMKENERALRKIHRREFHKLENDLKGIQELLQQPPERMRILLC